MKEGWRQTDKLVTVKQKTIGFGNYSTSLGHIHTITRNIAKFFFNNEQTKIGRELINLFL